MTRHTAFALIFTGISSILVSSAGCASCGQGALCSMRGTINNPENKTMRREMLATGLGKFCEQMTTRNAPLKLGAAGSGESPIIGRYYPTQCTQKDLPNGDLYVEFSGFGYAFTNLSKRMSFTMGGAVEYNQDFLVAQNECDIYAYFRTKNIASSNFNISHIEQPVASVLNQLSPLGQNFGNQLVSGKLAEGFTVIHDHDNNDDFDLGIIELGKRPEHPFQVHGSGRITVENARTEVHQDQRDFIGPIVVADDHRALYLTGSLDGLPALDVLIFGEDAGKQALTLYTQYPQAGPIPGPAVFSDVMQMGTPYSHTVPLPKGMYFVVLDNTPTAGATMPPQNMLDDRAGVVSYAIQIGDAP